MMLANNIENKMKATIIFFIVFCFSVSAQTDLKFVNYGPKASKTEGDDNYIQVINIQVPKDYSGNAFLRLYDMSCGSKEDIVVGSWNSKFRFSVYQGEHKEDDILKIPGYRAGIDKQILGRFEVGQDKRFYGEWSNFVNLNKKPSEDAIYSLVVEGVEGDDGNNFKVFVSSDSLDNKSIPGLILYSYQPTIALKRTDEEQFFIVKSEKQDRQVAVHTFDLDGTNCTFSTLLKDEFPLSQNSSGDWSLNKFDLTAYECENDFTFDIGPVTMEANDITFYLDNQDGKKYKVILEQVDKLTSSIPDIKKEFVYRDCNTINFDLNAAPTDEKDSLAFEWKFSDGFSAQSKSVQRSFEKSGKYTGECFVVDVTSKSITRAKLEKFDFVINDKPLAKAGDDLIAVPHQKIFFDGSGSSDVYGKIIDYEWNFGDDSFSRGQKVNHEYKVPGKYYVTLKVTDDYQNKSCNNAVDTVVVTINDQPLAITNDKVIGSVNQELTFDGSLSRDNDGSIEKYEWNFNELGIKEGKIVRQNFPNPGSYKIKLTVVDNSTAANNSSSKIVTVIINNPPKAVAGENKIVALNEEVTFDANKSKDSDGKIVQYEWSFGDGIKTTGVKSAHRFSKPGTYFVKLKVKDDSNTDTDTGFDSLKVIVNDKPVAKIKNEIFLNDGNAKFDASESSDEIGGIVKYIWTFGDGLTGEGKIVNHIYKIAGAYTVILKVIDNYNTSNNFSYDTSKVIINKKPIADAGKDKIVSVNQKVKFDGSNSVDPDGKIIAYKWFVDNVCVSKDENFDYVFHKPGIYNIGLQVTDDFKYPAAGIAFAKVKVNNPPIPSINCISIGAPKQKIKFDASQSKDLDGIIKEYNWNFGDGTKASGKTFEKSYENPGVYNVVLTVKDDSYVENSIVNDTVIVKVNSSPVIKVDETIETCDNIVLIDASKTTDPDGDNLSFTWEFPNQEKIKGSSIIYHNFSERGILPVSLSVDDGLGLANSVSRKTILVKIHQPPIANAGADTTICAGDILILSGLQSQVFEKGLLHYEWTFDDSVKLSGSNVFRVFKKGGIYSVTLKVTDDSGLSCNSAIDTKVIKVLDAPIAVAGDDKIACASSPVTFDGTQSVSPGGLVSSYNWEFGDGETGVGPNPIHIYSKPGEYKVTLTIIGDIKGKCDNTAKDNLKVTVTEAPVASFAAKDSIPENYECAFDASLSYPGNGKIIGYEWNFGDGSLGNGKIVKHKYLKYGNYNVVFTLRTDLKSECNSSSVTKLINVNSAPIADFDVKQECAPNELLTFDASKSKDADGKISDYYWDFGDGITKHGIKSAHQYAKSGVYNVILKVSDGTSLQNGLGEKTIMVKVVTVPEAKFQIPEITCRDDEIILEASLLNNNEKSKTAFEWFVNETKVSDNKIYKTSFTEPGQKRIKLIATTIINGISYPSEIVKYINVLDYPSVSIPKKIVICSGELLQLKPNVSESSNQLNFTWKEKKSSKMYHSNELNVSSLNQNEVYQLNVTSKSGKTIFADSTIVIINNPPELPKMSDTIIYIGKANDEFLFDASGALDNDGDFLKVQWNFGDGKFSDEFIGYHKYEKEGTYTVECEANDQKNTSCSKTKISFRVIVKKQ